MAASNNNPHDHHHQPSTALRLLVVDHDLANLKLIQDLAFQCNYQVTTCYEGSHALNLLREKIGCFDVVLCDVYISGIMDGSHQFFDQVLQEFNIPVVVMCSADDASSSAVMMEGMKQKRACYYNLVKPISEEDLSNLWQNVMMEKTRKEDYCDDDNESEGTVNKKKRSSISIERDDHDPQQPNTTPNKKPRFVWTRERHQVFVDAVLQLGIDKAVPKKIMELMDMPDLTRENVASHLQKYRLHMKKKSEETQQNSIGNWKPNNINVSREANNNKQQLQATTNNNGETLPLARYYSDLAAVNYPFYQPQPAIPALPNNNPFGGLINNNGGIGRNMALDHYQNNNNHGHRSIIMNLLQQQQQQSLMQNHYHHDQPSSSNLFQQSSDYYLMPTHRQTYDEAPFQVGTRGGPLFDYYNTSSSTPLHQMNNSLGGEDSGSIAQFHGGYTGTPAAASPTGFFSSRIHQNHQQQQLPPNNYPTSLAFAAAEALSYLSNSTTQVPTLYGSSSSSLFDDYQLGQPLFQG